MKHVVFNMVLILLLITSSALSAHAATMADSEFDSATTFLSTTKKATFSAGTYDEKSSITVTRVLLYKKSGNGTWSYVCELPAPDHEATNTLLYGASKDYSDYIGSGTYRLYTTFCADGHSISRYSNTRTY